VVIYTWQPEQRLRRPFSSICVQDLTSNFQDANRAMLEENAQNQTANQKKRWESELFLSWYSQSAKVEGLDPGFSRVLKVQGLDPGFLLPSSMLFINVRQKSWAFSVGAFFPVVFVWFEKSIPGSGLLYRFLLISQLLRMLIIIYKP
jgi:hypothetical protein